MVDIDIDMVAVLDIVVDIDMVVVLDVDIVDIDIVESNFHYIVFDF